MFFFFFFPLFFFQKFNVAEVVITHKKIKENLATKKIKKIKRKHAFSILFLSSWKLIQISGYFFKKIS